MNAKTKEVELGGVVYQFRRMAPDIGSYILMKLFSGLTAAALEGGIQEQQTKNISSQEVTGGTISAQEVATEPQGDKQADNRGELLVRTMALPAFSRMNFADYAFVQRNCLACVSRLESGAPMPIVNSSGEWAIKKIRDNVSLVMRLEVESLVFNLADFFSEGGMNGMMS